MIVDSQQTWICLVDVKPGPGSNVLNGDPGAYCHVLCRANSEIVVRLKIKGEFAELGLMVESIEDLEPLEQRRATGTIGEELLALSNEISDERPVVYGDLYVYQTEHEAPDDA